MSTDLATAIVDNARPSIGDAMVLTDYVVVAAFAGFDAEGHDVTMVVVSPHGNEHCTLGLLEHARLTVGAGLADLNPRDRP